MISDPLGDAPALIENLNLNDIDSFDFIVPFLCVINQSNHTKKREERALF
jgi:hypothetical protein